MREVQKISCVNVGAFVMAFQIATKNATSDKTGTFTVGNYKTINGKDMGLEPGTEMWPKIDIKGGDDRTGSTVRYQPNGQDACYVVSGTTGKSDVDLVGGTS